MSYKLTQTGQRVQELLNQIENGGQSQVTDAVLYSEQALNEKEQAQARKNIGAAAENQIPTGAVLYSQQQNLTGDQQAQARTNIGVPNKVSELENDAHYITESQVPTKISQFANDMDYATVGQIPTKVSQLNNDQNFTDNIGTITQIKINGKVKNPQPSGLIDLGNITPEPTDWTTVPITTALENGKTYVVKLDTTPYPLTAIFTMSAALDAIDANVVGGTQQGTDGTSTYELKSATITVKDGKLTGLKSTNLVSSANPGAANLSYSESTFADLGITQYHYVELLNIVGGGGAASYTKIESTIPTSAWVLSAPSWIGQDALTWSTRENAYYIKGGTEDLGLIIGSTYTATLTIDGTDYSADDSGVMEADGMNAYVAYFNNYSVMLQILDHCAGFDTAGNFTVGNGYYVMIMLIGETVPSSVIVKSFSGAEKISAAIENSAIKVNSAVKMFIDYSGKIKAVGKANGSLTVSANAIPTVDIPYAIEISDTNTEGLFEIINSYVPEMPKIPTQQQADWAQTDNTAVDYIKNKPEIPTIPTNLPQTAESVARQTWAKGETTIEVSDSSITYNSDIDIILSCEEVITGYSDIGKFTLRANSALTKNIEFEYKIKQTSGFGQMNIINNYRIPRDKFSANYLKVRASVQTSDWVASSEYSQYPYQAEIRITALKYLKDRFPVKPVKSIDTITADVVFDVKEALSGIFAPVCSVVKPKSDDEDVKVIIYASEDMTNYAYDKILIPTIKLTFEGDCGV